MSINRQNYEEYFILYADNELRIGERRMVEQFVEVNTDLKVELDLLMQMKLDPEDEMNFPDKASLFKPIELQDDQHQPTQEEHDLLMYLDNELEEEERLKFEQKLKADKKIRAEFDVFLNARVEPDFKVKFADKESLYRQTEKSGRLIRITWVRVAVAAAVILIAGLLWLNQPTVDLPTPATIAAVTGKSENDSSGKAVANSDKVEKGIQSGRKEELVASEQNTVVVSDEKNIAQNTKPLKGEMKKDQLKNTAAENLLAGTRQQVKSNNLPANRNETADKPNDKITPELIAHQQLVNVNNNDQPLPETIKANQNEAGIKQESKSMASFTSNDQMKTNYASDALLHGNDEEENITTAQMMEEDKPRKGALRGFFRKANRILNKVANPEPGSIASVRVAGFEIASAK